MRISDWSSDVCSSDLSVALIMRAQRYAEHTHVALVPAHDDVEAPAPAGYVIDRSHGLCRNQRMHNRNMNGRAHQDSVGHRCEPGNVAKRLERARKRVGLGKSGTGRVDLGGRQM